MRESRYEALDCRLGLVARNARRRIGRRAPIRTGQGQAVEAALRRLGREQGATLLLAESGDSEPCFLIGHGDNYLLWGSGISARAIGANHPVAKLDRSITDQLKQLRIAPEKVEFVGMHFSRPCPTSIPDAPKHLPRARELRVWLKSSTRQSLFSTSLPTSPNFPRFRRHSNKHGGG